MLRVVKCLLHLRDKESGEETDDDVTSEAIEWMCQGTDNAGPYLFLGSRINGLLKRKYKKKPKGGEHKKGAWELIKEPVFLEIEYEEPGADGSEPKRQRVRIVNDEEHFWVRPELVRDLVGEDDAKEESKEADSSFLEWSLDSLRSIWFKSAALGDVRRLKAIRLALGTRVAVDAACGPDFVPPAVEGVGQPNDDPQMTALMLACFFARQDAVVELLAQGADLNCVTGKFSDNAFMYACKRQTEANLDLSRFLLTQVDVPFSGPSHLLFFIYRRCPRLQVEGMDISRKNRGNGNLVLHAAANGNLAVVKLLCLAGLDPFQKNCRGRSAAENCRYSLELDYTRSAAFTAALEACATWLEQDAPEFIKTRAQNRAKHKEDESADEL